MRKLALLCALLLLLTACSPAEGPDADGAAYAVYFTASSLGGAALISEERRFPANSSLTEGLLDALLSGPAGEGLVSPIPAGTRLLSWQLDGEGVLSLDLSEQYGSLAGVDLTLADYAIALTLCQLPAVEAVSITVEGEAVAFRSHQLLRAADVILSGSEDAPVYYAATLYFPRAGGGLDEERRDLLITENDSLPAALIAALIAGPTESGSFFPFPAESELLSAYVEDGICYVSFSAAFVDHAPAERRDRTLLLYSIVNTLCTQAKVTAVHLLIDGSSIDSYGGIPTAAPLEPNEDLVVPNHNR